MPRGVSAGASSGWGGVVRPLVQRSRDHDCGFLLLHHPRSSDGQYRGSGEIAAAVDALIEMTMPTPSEDPTLRRFRGRARWPMEDWAIRMDEGAYLLGGGGPVPLETRIVMDTAAHPGPSRNAQHARLGGRTSGLGESPPCEWTGGRREGPARSVIDEPAVRIKLLFREQ